MVRWAGTFAFLFMPVIIAGSAMWGQADIFYIAFLVWMVYYLVKGNNFWATVCFAVAFSFKLQALMVAPLFLVLIARRKYPVYWLLVIPAVYFLSVVPAWIAGQPLKDLLMVYLAQFGQYTLPSANAANPYIFLNGVENHSLVNIIGLAVTTLAMLLYLGIRWFKWKDVSTRSILYDLALLTLLLPFLLPKMHDRYFLPAAVFLLLLTFVDARIIWAALLSQLALLFSYVPYFTHYSNEWVYAAALFNLAAVVVLMKGYWENNRHVENGSQG
jgi:Gpi18-like mannosyltransferase